MEKSREIGAAVHLFLPQRHYDRRFSFTIDYL